MTERNENSSEPPSLSSILRDDLLSQNYLTSSVIFLIGALLFHFLIPRSRPYLLCISLLVAFAYALTVWLRLFNLRRLKNSSTRVTGKVRTCLKPTRHRYGWVVRYSYTQNGREVRDLDHSLIGHNEGDDVELLVSSEKKSFSVLASNPAAHNHTGEKSQQAGLFP